MSTDATYLWLNDVQAGPFTSLQLRAMWTAGSITAATLCYQEGMEEWTPLGTSVEEAIAQEKLSEQQDVQRQQIATERRMQKAAVNAKKEKPIGESEWLAIIAFSIIASPFAFLLGLIYYFTGKQNRGLWLCGTSPLAGLAFYILIERTVVR